MSKNIKHALMGNRIIVDIVSDVRDFEGSINGYVITIGKITVNDGLAREYYWNPASVDADNGDTVLKPTDTVGAGRWIKVVKSEGVIGVSGRISGDGINSVYQVAHTMNSVVVILQITDSNNITVVPDTVQRFSSYIEVTFSSVVPSGTNYNVLMIFLGI